MQNLIGSIYAPGDALSCYISVSNTTTPGWGYCISTLSKETPYKVLAAESVMSPEVPCITCLVQHVRFEHSFEHLVWQGVEVCVGRNGLASCG